VKELMIVVFTGLALVTFQTRHVDWKALVPLVTTRTQLEANLGTPTSGNGNILVQMFAAGKFPTKCFSSSSWCLSEQCLWQK
jgi:hypothetical protein